MELDIEQLRAQHKPIKEPVVREDGAPLDPGVPPELVVSIWLGKDCDQITPADASIMIADFGEAFEPSKTRRYAAHAPLLIAPPESRFADAGDLDEPLSFPSDIWTLACTIWEIFGCGPPFESLAPSLDDVTIQHVDMLGKLPERWWREWKERANWFDEDGRKNVKEELRWRHWTGYWDWDTRFSQFIRLSREDYEFDYFTDEEEIAFQSMLKAMLVLEPTQRATIQQVLDCEWMQRWGLPELREMHACLDSSKG